MIRIVMKNNGFSFVTTFVIVIMYFFSACTEKSPTIATIGNAGVLQAVNLTTGDVFEKEMYGAEVGKISDTLNGEFSSTMYVNNGDLIQFSYVPNSTCSKFDLKPVLLAIDTVVTLSHNTAYKYEYEISNLSKGDRGKIFLLVRDKVIEDDFVSILSVADFAIELK